MWLPLVEDHFEVVIAEDDVKLRHVAVRPQCSPVVFETVRPFRGARVEGAIPVRYG